MIKNTNEEEEEVVRGGEGADAGEEGTVVTIIRPPCGRAIAS
jgi:hypothetical protein